MDEQEVVLQALAALTNLCDVRDPQIGAHSARVRQHALMIARQMMYASNDPDAWVRLERGALLHDIGMVGMPDAILKKEGPLTNDEFATIQAHTTLGFGILSGFKVLTDELLIVRSHHERFDGTGYPDRKKGDELPIFVWIASAADAIDAMTSDRPYRPSLPLKVAVDHVRAGAGTQFHPDVAEAVSEAARNGNLAVASMGTLPTQREPVQSFGSAGGASHDDLSAQAHVRRQHRQFAELNRVGIALSAERDINKLEKLILTTVRQLTNADGASLWLKKSDDLGRARLYLAASQLYSIDGDTDAAFSIPLDKETVVGYVVTMGSSELYDDAYAPPPGKPATGRAFDAQFGYRTKSMLTVPMRNHDNEVVGAIQLINAKRRFEAKLTSDNIESEVVSFQPENLEMIESIASQGAVALDNKNLLDSMHASFDGFVRASIVLIQQRDPTIAGHSLRVATLANGLARAVNELAVGKYRDVRFTEDQFTELRYASLLHDIGMLAVREHILVKASTLSDKERLEVQSHVIHGFQYLSTIPWPPRLRNIPEIAYAHHEKLDGSGYPRGLTSDQIPIQTKMMTIADIYDALTAHDRPHKGPLPVDRALDIVRFEADHGAIDPDLLEVFITKRIYELTSLR